MSKQLYIEGGQFMSLNWDKGKAQRMSRLEEGVLIVAYVVGWVTILAMVLSK